MMILATAETAVTIAAASIPVLRVLIKKTFHGGDSASPHFYHYYQSQSTGANSVGTTSLGASSVPSRNHSENSDLLAPSPTVPPTERHGIHAFEGGSRYTFLKKKWPRFGHSEVSNAKPDLELAPGELNGVPLDRYHDLDIQKIGHGIEIL
jgi:hypothetical protein